MRQQLERPQHPRAKGALLGPAGRVGPAQYRRRQMEGHLEIAVELGPGLGFGVAQQTGDLVFVLVGQQLVIALGDG